MACISPLDAPFLRRSAERLTHERLGVGEDIKDGCSALRLNESHPSSLVGPPRLPFPLSTALTANLAGKRGTRGLFSAKDPRPPRVSWTTPANDETALSLSDRAGTQSVTAHRVSVGVVLLAVKIARHNSG